MKSFNYVIIQFDKNQICKITFVSRNMEEEKKKKFFIEWK